MFTPRRSIQKAMSALLGLALLIVAGSAFADEDPPDRVARLSYLRGDVSFQPSGGDDWVQANLNRPLGTGDKLFTDRDSRVEMEVGAATLRLDAETSFDILNLDDNVAQTELTGGTLNLAVRRVFEGQSYEVDTPTLAFVVTQPGEYRVDIAPDGSSTMVTVFDGAGDVYGENNASYSVRSGQSYRFHDSALNDYEVLDLPRADDFDQWVRSRNDRYAKSVSSDYVADGVIGYADLDDYGGWNDEPDYGHVWYPTTVETGWAPYRYGHWSWIDPWGWTWVDNAAWGFAPFHYGRWVYVRNRWGWCPGPRHVRAIYAPAMVAFVGGSGWGVSISTGPVGWFPLGPRDVYVPWYRTSRNYFTNVNVRNTTIINNTYITNVYNNYSRGRPITANYAYRQNVAAVTAVPRAAFVGARPVNAARVEVNASQLRNASVASRVGIAPERASFVGARPVARAKPAAQTLNRAVIARTAPPPRPAPVATRIQAIKSNNGQPLARTELRRIAAPAAAATGAAANRGQPSRVRVVGQNAAAPKPLPARAPATPNTRATPPNARATPNERAIPNARTVPTERATPNARTTPTERATPNARTTPTERATPNARTTPSRGENPNANGLPSSRFAPHRNATTGGNAPSRTTPATPPSRTATPRSQPRSPSSSRTATPPAARTAPTPRTTPAENAPRRVQEPARKPVEAPQRSASPPPTQRSAPRTVAPRTEQPSRQTQREYAPRRSAEPPQRSTPPRSAAPVQRTAPQHSSPPPQTQRSAPVQRKAAPPERRAPPPSRNEKGKKKDDDDHH